MSKKMKVLMIVSLLLNVFLVGIIIGDMSHRFRKKPPIGKHARELASKLPEDKAAIILKTMETVHMNNRDVRKQIREARQRAMNIMTAQRFDEAAYQIQVEKLHELRGLMMQRLASVTMELATKLNQQERKILAQYLKRPPRPLRDRKPPRGSREPRHRIP